MRRFRRYMHCLSGNGGSRDAERGDMGIGHKNIQFVENGRWLDVRANLIAQSSNRESLIKSGLKLLHN